MESAWAEMKVNISLANKINTSDAEVATFHDKLRAALQTAVTRCRAERKRKAAGAQATDLSDDTLRQAARFTDHLPLADYASILHLVPRLVNVVTAARASLNPLRVGARAGTVRPARPPKGRIRSWIGRAACPCGAASAAASP